MKLTTTAGLVLLALAAACTEPSKPLAVPDPAEIESMYVYRLNDSVNSWAYETMDRRRIAAVLAHLREHNTGYRVATRLSVRLRNSHLPDHDYQILFLSAADIPLGVYIGPDWLAGKDDLVKFPESERRLNLSRQRPLGASEREALVALVEPQPMGGDLRFFIGPDKEPAGSP
jgi:hypothetical protein